MGRGLEGGISHIHTTMRRIRANGKLLYVQSSSWVLCDDPRGCRGEREGGSRGKGYLYACCEVSCPFVQQKPMHNTIKQLYSIKT